MSAPRWLLAGVVFPAVGIAASVIGTVRGDTSPVTWGLLGFNGSLFALNLYFYLHRRNRHGSDRRTEAGSQDPDSGTFTFSWDRGATAAWPAGTYTAIGTGPGLATGGVVPSPTHGEVETVESDMPILAHRIARLRFDGKAPFVSLNEGQRFGLDADATCSKWSGYQGAIRMSLLYGENIGRPHEVPSIGCSCGFYALPSDIEPWDEGADYVTLLVELSGTVIEHEKGYRAGHQRVVECQIPACPYCSRKADVVLAVDAQMVTVGCNAHLPASMPTGAVAVAVADLEALIGVPVTSRGHEREDQQ